MQTGSRALYFAQCSDQNETWLPLLEKAYAKAHGDYAAIDGGFVGEGIEDLTGGVTTEVFATDILDRDRFWHDELMKVNKEFLFGCGQMGGVYGQRRGIQERHAYSIMEAIEKDGVRLLKLRNPWGNTEWRGPWSDGSAEWTPEWMEKLDHRFGDDGIFWISYQDLLRNYQHFDRTRLFGDEWSVTQRWTSVNVPWSVNYLDTKFKVTLKREGPVVIVLSQLDDRYFRGLEGQYLFHLQFRIHKEGEDDYIVRSNGSYYMKRSVSTELTLEAGTYIVLPKITATRDPSYPTPEEVVRGTCRDRREKLLQIGLSYDLAHAKGGFRSIAKEKKEHSRRMRYERLKTNLKKEHEARTKVHRKQKLKNMRMQEKKMEKAARRMEREREEDLDERLSGLGIDDGGRGVDYFQQGGGNPGTSFTNGGAGGGPGASDSRPATPNNTNRPASPNFGAAIPGRMRSDTLPIHRNDSLGLHRRNTLSPVPNIYVHRPSIGSRRLTLEEVSDDDLSWDSELMGPDSELSEPSDDEERVPHGFREPNTYGAGMGHDGFSLPGRESEDEEDEELDPWNAVVCIGLRVYSLDVDVEIDILRPDDGVYADGVKRMERTLDLDDSAKDATKHGRTPVPSERGSEHEQEHEGEGEGVGLSLDTRGSVLGGKIFVQEPTPLEGNGRVGGDAEGEGKVEVLDGVPAMVEESRQG